MEIYHSLHFWLAAGVRRDNSSTVLGLVLLWLMRRKLCLVNII